MFRSEFIPEEEKPKVSTLGLTLVNKAIEKAEAAGKNEEAFDYYSQALRLYHHWSAQTTYTHYDTEKRLDDIWDNLFGKYNI